MFLLVSYFSGSLSPLRFVFQAEWNALVSFFMLGGAFISVTMILTFVHEDYEYVAVAPNLIESTSSFHVPMSGDHTMYSEYSSDPAVGS